MMREQRHPAGTFPTCKECGIEPRHILDQRRRPVGGHLLSCACGDSTKHDSLEGATNAWCNARGIHYPERFGGNVLRMPPGYRQQVQR